MARTKQQELSKTKVGVVRGVTSGEAASGKDVGKVHRRKRRMKRWKQEIRAQQRQTGTVSAKSQMSLLCRSIIYDLNPTLRVQRKALDALHVMAEQVLTEYMKKSNELALECCGLVGPGGKQLRYMRRELGYAGEPCAAVDK